MNLVVRRRLAVGALVGSTALVAGLMIAPSSSAATNGLTIDPSGATNNEPAKVLTFTGQSADFEFGGTATFTRVLGGRPFDVAIDGTQPFPQGNSHSEQATVNFTDPDGDGKDTSGNNAGGGVGKDGPADAGVYNVSATGAAAPIPGNPLAPGGGNDTCASCFTVLPAGQVSVSSISPLAIRPGNTVNNASIIGNNFERGTTIQFLLPDGSVDPLITGNANPKDTSSPPKDIITGITTRTTMNRLVHVDSADQPGSRGIRVTNLDGTTGTCTDCFFVSGPVLTGISTTSAFNDPTGAPVSITFNGSNVTNGDAYLEFTGDPGSASRAALAIKGVTTAPSNGTSITATFDFKNAAPGAYQAVVRNPTTGVVNACEQPACPIFTVQQRTPDRDPTVTGLDSDTNTAGNQNSQAAGTTKTFDVLGTNFSKGVKIVPTAKNVTVTAVQFLSPSIVRATITAASTAAAGTYDVTAVLTNGKTSAVCKGCYVVTAGASPAPSASGSTSPKPSTSASGCPTASAAPSSSATPGPSPSDTATSSISPSPSSSCAPLTVALSKTDIEPTQASVATLHGAPNTAVELYAYTRPSTTYRKVRSGTTDASGNISWPLTPGENTRLYGHYTGNGTTASNDSPSRVINVHTTLSLSAVRTGVRKYTFQGRNLPRLGGQLITLYRLDAAGHEIRTANVRTDASGTWHIPRTFTGSGTFRFIVRTGQTLNNAPGKSAIYTTNIH